MKLNDELIQQFMTTFYGSGNYEGDYWFIGMEEGGGNSLDEVQERIIAWQNLGGTELVDIYDFHARINYLKYFRNPVKLQRTWMQYARITLASKGLSTTSDNVKVYQRDIIGRKKSETCLLELLPLPSPKASTWNYEFWSNLPFLRTRKVYEEHCISWRCEHIRSRIQEYQPKLVIFCGLSYTDYWKSITGNDVFFKEKDGFLVAKPGKTLVLVVKHPSTIGITNAYFESVGSFIRSANICL